MDPDANWAEQQALRALPRLSKWQQERLDELVQALNEWINRGGFLPKEWVR